MKPAIDLTINGFAAKQYLIEHIDSLKLTDKSGFEADQLDITIDDSRGIFELPKSGALINVAIGWQGQDLANKGQFVVDESEHAGPPDKIIIRASSADFQQSWLEIKEKSWHQITLGELVSSIAGTHGLSAKVSDSIARINLTHIDQHNESDAHLLTRLAKVHGAIATIKGGVLLFVEKAGGKTATGKVFEPITIDRSQCINHRYLHSNQVGRYSGVKAIWYDKKLAKKREEIAGKKGYLKALRKVFSTPALAISAANAEWKRLHHKVHSMNVSLTAGIPELVAEQPVIITGYKPQINVLNWIVDEAMHELGRSGFTSNVALYHVPGKLSG